MSDRHCEHPDRRSALTAAALIAAGGVLLAPAAARAAEEKEVGATEDMMREHGVLRRILIVYRESATALRHAPAQLDARALLAATELFRAFGEDYHEQKLEEAHVFPQVRKVGGEAARLIDTLLLQHRRGREINAFVAAKCRSGRVAAGDAAAVSRALESFARMYEKHAAIEDTIVFQAWRQSLSAHQLDEAGELFEQIERQQFKGDGFDKAVDRVAEIERALGLYDPALFTAPPPPSATA